MTRSGVHLNAYRRSCTHCTRRIKSVIQNPIHILCIGLAIWREELFVIFSTADSFSMNNGDQAVVMCNK